MTLDAITYHVKTKQRKWLTCTEFDFSPSRLTYTYKTPSGAKEITMDYADIAFERRRVMERYSAHLYVGLVLFGVGALLGALIYETENRLSGFNYAVIGLIFLVAYFIQRKEYVVLTAGNDVIVVLTDRNSTAILGEIDRLRKARFLEILRRPDLMEDEIRRRGLIAWLLERGALTDQEGDALLKGREAPQSDQRPMVH
jgi:hypothetical protein